MPATRPSYADLATLPENKRIEIIGRCVAVQQLTVAVALENDAKKIERYRQKLNTAHPDLLDIEQLPGLVPGTVTLKVKPKAHNVAHN